MRDKFKSNLGDNYDILERDLLTSKFRILDDLGKDKSNIRIIHKINVINHKFNVLVEVNNYGFGCFQSKEKLNVEWSRCRLVEHYGIIRF